MLRIEDVTKTFGGLKALDSVNLVCGAGKATGLIGPNGSGKTTLFNLITGVLSRDSGRITLDELDLPISRPDEVARRGLIRTYQIPRLATQMTVLENLMAVPRNTRGDGLLAALLRSRGYQRSEAEVLDRAWTVLHQIELGHMANEWAAGLSGGQRKLLSLGMAVMADPKVLLLDEPGAGVNPTLIMRNLKMMRHLRDTGVAILIIEHNMQMISNLCDEVYVLDGGKVIAHGPPADIRADLRVRQAYLGTKG